MSNTPILEGIRLTDPNLLGSGTMVAIAECLMGVPVYKRSTDNKIEALCVDSSGCVLAMHVGDIGYNNFLGPYEELKRNVTDLAEHFGAYGEAEIMLKNVKTAGVDS